MHIRKDDTCHVSDFSMGLRLKFLIWKKCKQKKIKTICKIKQKIKKRRITTCGLNYKTH